MINLLLLYRREEVIRSVVCVWNDSPQLWAIYFECRNSLQLTVIRKVKYIYSAGLRSLQFLPARLNISSVTLKQPVATLYLDLASDHLRNGQM